MCIVHSVEKRCRLCFSDDENVSIFDPQFREEIPLALKIMVCVSLTVSTFMCILHMMYITLLLLCYVT
jgi:hypothetical protein